jgi:hypothetical protein
MYSYCLDCTQKLALPNARGFCHSCFKEKRISRAMDLKLNPSNFPYIFELNKK